MASKKMNILLVSVEVAPFAKVGGLADVAGALPKALKALGHDVRVVMPCYKMVEDNPAYNVKKALGDFPVPIHDGLTETASVKQTTIGDDVPVYLISHERYFQDATESKKVYTLEPEPYVFFDRAVTEFVPRLKPTWKPDIVHCNDWHTGLIPAYLKTFKYDTPAWANAAGVYTIHNMAYQGEYSRDFLRATGLPDSLFTFDKLEFYGNMSFMKGGLTFSEVVNTVSVTYADEIQTNAYGCGLDGLMRYLASEHRLAGIVNGIDYEEYNPATDKRITANFTAEKPAGKAKCKSALQKECGLPQDKKAAVIGLISRLADQKGLDLIHAIVEPMLEMPVQFILLGTGDTFYEKFFRELEARYPQQVKANIVFDADLAQRIYSGSDLFLMPSRFEPCGLGQLMSLRYGTIPIVRSTGGLADTIQDYDAVTGEGNGFSFVDYNSEVLLQTIKRAVQTFGDNQSWKKLVNRALTSDFSWAKSASKYDELYKQAKQIDRLKAVA